MILIIASNSVRVLSDLSAAITTHIQLKRLDHGIAVTVIALKCLKYIFTTDFNLWKLNRESSSHTKVRHAVPEVHFFHYTCFPLAMLLENIA